MLFVTHDPLDTHEPSGELDSTVNTCSAVVGEAVVGAEGASVGDEVGAGVGGIVPETPHRVHPLRV